MKYKIIIKEVEGLLVGVYKVSLAGGERHEEFTYTVTVDEEYVVSLGWEFLAVIELLKQSFEFLLEREPATSILKEFDLRVIAKYFPEYVEVIGK